jgi:branched-chain amino acid transport system substrate-binding protein
VKNAISRRAALGGTLATGALAATPRRARAAAAADTIKIGILTDLSATNSAGTGKGTVTGVKLAIEDFLATSPGIKVDLMVADFQAKADIALSMGRDWLDNEGVDVLVNIQNSAAALAVADLVRDKDKVALFTGPASSDLTGKACSPNHIHWVYDTWALGHTTGTALVADGGDSWYFIAADYAFGRALAGDTASFVTAAGGKVLGTVYTPFPETTDFSAFLLQAKSSGAKVIGLANSGDNTVNCIKQAGEFGITKAGVRLASLLLTIPDVHATGLAAAQGLVLTEGFYWDMNDATRAWSKRFGTQMNGAMPNMIQAGDYSAVTHYLKAVRQLGLVKARESGRGVVAAMKAMPTDDAPYGKGTIRADGRKIHPMYLFQVKSPAESKYPWDYYKLLQTVPADQAFRPLADGHCKMVTG